MTIILKKLKRERKSPYIPENPNPLEIIGSDPGPIFYIKIWQLKDKKN